MKYVFLLLLLLPACRSEQPESVPNCAGTQAATLPDAQRLVVGEWRLIGKDVRLQVTADSIRVFDRNQLVGTFGWTLAKASTGDITYQGTWDALTQRGYLPDPWGYVSVCNAALRLGTCIIDGVCYSYERVR